MKHLLKKAFSLRDIKYGWLLLVSIAIFFTALYLDLDSNPSHISIKAVISYGAALIVSVVWGAINYIGHIRVNVMYRKNNDIHAFVDKLAMSQEDKLELQVYLEDYIQDLISQGKEKEDATEIAIDHFKIKEFSSLSKDTQIFNMHAHYYLWGYTIIATLLCLLLLFVTNVLIESSLALIVMESSFFVCAFGFTCLFFVYKLMDSIFYKKL